MRILPFLFIFNWGIIALQYWFHFCHTSTCGLAIGAHVSPPSWTSFPPPTLFHPWGCYKGLLCWLRWERTHLQCWVWSLGQGDSLAKEMAAHSSVLAWRIPWTEEPGRLQSGGSQRVGRDWVTKHSPGLSRLSRTAHFLWYKMRILMWVIHWETFSGETYKDTKEVG